MSLDRLDLQILGMQIQNELQAERYSRERIAIMNARSAMMREIAERNYQQNQIAMQREAQEQNLAYIALRYAPRRTSERPGKKVVIPEIEVNVLGRDLEYFMTNDQNALDSELQSWGYRPWTTSDWFLNLELAQSVRSTMEQVGAIFSMTINKDCKILNYWDPEASPVPFSLYLDNLQ